MSSKQALNLDFDIGACRRQHEQIELLAPLGTQLASLLASLRGRTEPAWRDLYSVAHGFSTAEINECVSRILASENRIRRALFNESEENSKEAMEERDEAIAEVIPLAQAALTRARTIMSKQQVLVNGLNEALAVLEQQTQPYLNTLHLLQDSVHLDLSDDVKELLPPQKALEYWQQMQGSSNSLMKFIQKTLQKRNVDMDAAQSSIVLNKNEAYVIQAEQTRVAKMLQKNLEFMNHLRLHARKSTHDTRAFRDRVLEEIENMQSIARFLQEVLTKYEREDNVDDLQIVQLQLTALRSKRLQAQEDLIHMKAELQLLQLHLESLTFIDTTSLARGRALVADQENRLEELLRQEGEMKERLNVAKQAALQRLREQKEQKDEKEDGQESKAGPPRLLPRSHSLCLDSDDVNALLPERVHLTGLVRPLYRKMYTIVRSLTSEAARRKGVATYLASLKGQPCVLKEYDLAQPNTMLLFDNEVHIRHKLNQHPAIEGIDAVFVDGQKVYMQMKYHDAGNLKQWLEADPKPAPHQVQHVFSLILEALTNLHSHNFIHGNLKFENVLVSGDAASCQPLLLDFAFAFETLPHLGITLIDPSSMYEASNPDLAPELQQGQSPSKYSDMWAFGIMLFRAHFELDPFPDLSPAVMGVVVPHHPNARLRDVLSALLKIHPSVRPLTQQTARFDYFSASVIDELIQRRELSFLSPEQRLANFRSWLSGINRGDRTELSLDRERIVPVILGEMRNVNQQSLVTSFRVSYHGSPGIDAGGLVQDLFSEFFVRVVAPEYRLFESVSEDDAPINGLTYLPKADAPAADLRATGAFLCKALIDGRAVPAKFAPSVFKYFTEQRVTMEDLERYDRSKASSLRRVLGMQDSELDEMQLDFSGLMPDGENVLVTSMNKRTYVEKEVSRVLVTSRESSLSALREGFFSYPNLQNQVAMLNAEDLRILLVGVDEIDPVFFISQIEFSGFDNSRTPDHIRNIIRGLSTPDLRRLLRLATSMYSMPRDGLARKITIRCYPNSDRLPQAHTCFHTLDFPDYNNEMVCRRKLMQAISTVDAMGFDFG